MRQVLDQKSASIYLDLIDFLSNNKESITEDMKDIIAPYFENEGDYKGAFRMELYNARDNTILSYLRAKLMEHFPSVNQDTMMELIDKHSLMIMFNNYFFCRDTYKREIPKGVS